MPKKAERERLRKVNPIVAMLYDERRRSERMLRAFESEAEKLPKGSLIRKRRGERVYFYLSYRENGRAVCRYIPADRAAVTGDEIERRKRLKEDIREIRYGIKVLDRALKGEPLPAEADG